LENSFWRLELDPATLAIRVTPAQSSAVQASAGVAAHKVNDLQEHTDRIDWQWDDGAWILSAELDQRDLLLSIKARNPSELDFLKQPGSAMGKGLIWPLAEGHYVPAGDGLWKKFLLDQGELNTTQDLSLPIWGVDHGVFNLNWLITNPYNNRLTLSAEGKHLALAASHEFTSLDPTAPLTFILSLGDGDPLAGAKRYRQWLIDNGRYETLNEKLLKTPEGKKLLGAIHIYLWGNGLLGLGDIQSWPELLLQLQGRQPLATELRGLLDGEALEVLGSAMPDLTSYQQNVLLRGLNSALSAKARQSWQASAEPDVELLSRRYGELRDELAELFGDSFTADPTKWGGSVVARKYQAIPSGRTTASLVRFR
jgi:hypothetical protein